ncbi:MAG: glucosidase family protein [Armatimonadota bacterium]
MHFLKHPSLLLAALLLTGCTQAQPLSISNDYIRIDGTDGVIRSLRVSSTPKGKLSENIINGFSLFSPVANKSAKVTIDKKSHTLHIQNAAFGLTRIIEYPTSSPSYPVELKPGGVLAQQVEFKSGRLRRLAAQCPTWHTGDSTATFSLYRIDNGQRQLVSQMRPQLVGDGTTVWLDAKNSPAGTYSFEMSNPKGTIGWWQPTSNGPVPGASYVNDQEAKGKHYAIKIEAMLTGYANAVCKLDGPKLTLNYQPTTSLGDAKPWISMKMGWVKSGYDVKDPKIKFNYIVANNDIVVPVYLFKRRTESYSYNFGWMRFNGRFGADIQLGPVKLKADITENEMDWHIEGTKLEISVLPHKVGYPDHLTSFDSSNPKLTNPINEFLFTHNYSHDIGVNPDWADWMSAQMCYTTSKQAGLYEGVINGHFIQPNGYVNSWGAMPGWPFPFTDANGDGLNDLDTRHMPTNPNLIIGSQRLAAWNGDSTYLATVVNRARRAMGFMLNDLGGKDGLLVIDYPGLQGRNNEFGSNYWDITPFGYKCAFTNSIFPRSLEAMATLEEMISADPKAQKLLPASTLPARDPAYYRALAKTAIKKYNETFWLEDQNRYAGCIDKDGTVHDYGFTFVNLQAMAFGEASPERARRIFNWMETGTSYTGKQDIISKHVFAMRASTELNPGKTAPQTPKPSWWHRDWPGTNFEEQCQAGGAILYTTAHEIMARLKLLGTENAWSRFKQVLGRYMLGDRLSGGSPLITGQTSQGGPGGTAGACGIEGEFPESGLVPSQFLYVFMGIDATKDGLRIAPNLPTDLSWASVKNMRWDKLVWNVRVDRQQVSLKCLTKGHQQTITRPLVSGAVTIRRGEVK